MRRSTIINIPLIDGRHKNSCPTSTPVLFFLEGSPQGPYWELAEYVLSGLTARWFRARRANYIVRTLQRFVQVFDIHSSGRHADESSLSDTLSIYCYIRYAGTHSFEAEIWKNIDWALVSSATIWNEFRLLIDFFDFCQEEYGYLNFRSQKVKFTKRSSFMQRGYTQKRASDFLAHLNTQRDRWEKLLQREALKFPAILRDGKSIPTDRTEKAIQEEELCSIIKAETNPVFKALFILYGYGGLRVSEPLHFWQIDFLPPSSWSELDGQNNSTPLILRCHPSASKYLGDFGKRGPTRKEFLAQRYQMLPRNLLSESDIGHCGWKGTKSLHKLNFAPVFLLASFSLIDQLMECIREIQHFHQLHRTSNIHPYFFCNIHSRRHEHLGAPSTISNVQGAWNNAAKRVGLIPHRENRNLHALRHHYVAKAQSLGLSSQQIQDMVGHSNEESQRVYGNKISLVQGHIERFLKS